jgi:beta-barrel assembly-enhancing protease
MNLLTKYARPIALLLAVSITGVVPMAGQVKTRDLVQDPKTGRITPTSDAAISPQEQIKVGQQAAAQVKQQMPVLPDNSPETIEMRRIGEKLISHAPGYKWPFEFHTLNQKDINAFALPGGPMFVNLGAIQQADESELAGVMAHELSHVILQHAARDAKKEQGAQILGVLGAVIAGAVLGNGIAGQAAGAVSQLGAGAFAMKFSRADETEADLLGAQLMYDAGYDPYALVEFFDMLAKQGGSGPQFLSDHPNPGNRAQTISAAVKKFPKKSFPRSDSAEFASMKQHAMGMKAMTAQEVADYAKKHQGNGQRGNGGGSAANSGPPAAVRATHAQVMPQGGMRSQDFGPFSMSYPSNWKTTKSQDGGYLIAPEAGVFGDSIAYGVMVQGVQPQQRMSFDEVTNQILQGLVQGNQGASVNGSTERTTVNGVDARSVMIKAISPLETQNKSQTAERDWLVTMDAGNNTVMYAVFTAPEQDFASLKPTYEDMLRSFQLPR